MFSLLAGACHEQDSAQREPDEYPVGVPSVGARLSREFVAEIRAVRHAEFRAHHRGIVEELGVDEGQEIHRGALMFVISAKELEAERAKAEAAVAVAVAELRAAQVEAENTGMLRRNQVASQPELELAEARVEALAARVREARAQAQQAAVRLDFARVRAPFDGVVNRLPNKVGSLVLEDELLTTLADTTEVFAYVRLSERDYLDSMADPSARQAERIGLRLANGAEYPHPGSIDAVEGEIDRETGTIAFRARFPNPEGLLKHGATATVVIERDLPDAVVVPQRATFEIQENVYVYVVDSDAIVHAVRVTPSARLGDAFVIGAGLASTDRIVLEGAQRLRDGMQINAISPPLHRP
jgi:membrane fusion protein (multidrug efflux system)